MQTSPQCRILAITKQNAEDANEPRRPPARRRPHPAARLGHPTREGPVLANARHRFLVRGLPDRLRARYEFGITPRQCALALGAAGVCAVIHAAFEQVRFTARGRHPVGSVGEARDLGGTVVLAAAVALAALLPMTERPIPASVPVLGAAVALLLMGAGRVTYRWRRDRDARPARSADRTLIYGVDAASERLARVLLGDPTSGYLPVGLLDDDPDKQGLRMAGLRVLGGRKQLVQAVRDTRAGTVIFSINGSDAALMRDVRSRTLQAGAAFKVLPPVRELLDRPVTADAVRDLQLTDLLGRAQRVAELTVERNGLAGRRVLVTGAGGSIGSELCRQIARFEPGRADHARPRRVGAARACSCRSHGRALLDEPELILADIRDARAASPQIFAERRPDVVFHAAALKHLPLLRAASGRGGQDQRLGHPERAGGAPRRRRRAVREHLHRQGGQPDQRARLLQADHRAADGAPRRPATGHRTSASASATCSAAAVRCSPRSRPRSRPAARSPSPTRT